MNDLLSIPEVFLRLHRAGRFDYWGVPYRSLTDGQRAERMRTHLARVLWWRSIEWDRAPDQIIGFQGDDFLRPGLIPFAGTGYGDYYCWYPRWQEAPEPPVVLCLHDEQESPLFARNLVECLCRCFLQDFAHKDADDETWQIVDPSELWDAHFEILRPFLNPAQISLLRSVRSKLSKAACLDADQAIAEAVGTRTLIGFQLPTRYADDEIGDRTVVLRLYDQSIAFFRELVEVEGLGRFRPMLAEAEANRAAVADRG